VPAREADRPLRIGCAQELRKFSHVNAGTPGNPSPTELSAFLIVCYECDPGGLRRLRARPAGRGHGLGLPPGAGTLAGRADWCPRGPAVWGHSSGRTVRLSEFWTRMRAQFGDAYAASVAKDHVLAALGERTVDQALADGMDAKTVWRAVCAEFDVPQRLR
jgi:hypothetical protein